MTTIAVGVQRTVAYKKESVFGADPGTGSAQYVPRVTSSLDLSKDTYESKQIRQDYQVADMRHGVRKVGGDIKDEMACGVWADFFAAICRKSWAAGATTGAITTLSSVAGTTTIHRSSGSFLTDGFKVGDIINMTGWGTTMATTNNRDYRIATLTATDMKLSTLNDAAMDIVTLAAGDSVTIVVKGKKTLVPLTGHTNDSFTIEHSFLDIGLFEQFKGCRVNSLDLQMPSTGMSELTWNMMGQNGQKAGSAYYVSPAATLNNGLMAAINGRLMIDGVDSQLITSIALKMEAGMTTGSVVGSNQTPDVFVGRIRVSGTVGVYFSDATLRDAFWDETPIGIAVALSEDNTDTSDAFNIIIPRIKLGGFTRADSETALVATAPFTALLNTGGGAALASDQTTISFQDTSLS